MHRDLLLFAAGKAFASAPSTDHQRELKDAGKRQAQRFGVWMQENRLLPDTTVTSSAVRAVVSAEKALKAGGQSAREIATDARLYQGGQAAHLDVISAHSGPDPLLIVSHPEALSELTASLCPEAADVPFSDGTAVWLTLTTQDKAELRSVIQPESLPKGFPFPGPGSDQRRKRPPYYYTQSAVIPYRRTPDLEILIISSSKSTHWVLPKGIHEPGLTAQQSAAEEAFEEAGIRGRVHDCPVGIWRLHKWGGTCTVTTYALEVTEVLEDAAWQENHRTRVWVSPSQAAQQIRNPELAAIVAQFTPPAPD